MIVDAETRDSYVVWDSTRNRYCIYYNDLDYTIVNSNRVRWNLAHELGHIVLEHHKLCKHHKLFRDGLSSSIYNYLEEEANMQNDEEEEDDISLDDLSFDDL